MVPRQHEPVLTNEVVQALDIKSNGTYVDATFGRGGHARAIISHLGPDARLLLLDRDPEAIRSAREIFAEDARVHIVKCPFSELGEAFRAALGASGASGIVVDLGVSSPQLDAPERGFSFSHDGPLDMRMDPDQGQTAAQWLASVTQQELAAVLRELGEERFARRIARAIVRRREVEPLASTADLARTVAAAVPTREAGKHPATRTFLAIRMYINRELDELKAVLPQALELLEPGGRLVVISFHSLEDREVKRFLRRAARGDPFPRRLPVRHAELHPQLRLVGRPVRPGERERARNPRARSAVMRVAERLG